LVAETFQIVRSEYMPVEGDSIAETSTNYIIDSPVPPKKEKVKGMEECEILGKTFIILTLSAAASMQMTDAKFLFIHCDKLQNYILHTRNRVQHKISNIIFAANRGHFDASHPFPTLFSASHDSFCCVWFRRHNAE
jgi:hypothetical protein